MSTVIYDGHDLSEIGICGNPEITRLSASVSYADSDSRDGSAVLGRRLANASVAFSIGVEGAEGERNRKLSTLAAWLDVDGPKPLSLPGVPWRYCMAIQDGEMSAARGVGGEIVTLAFEVTEPIAYGDTRTLTVPSGGSATFRVGGTAKARPRITASAVRDASSQVWGLRLDEGDFVHVATGSASARSIAVDCDARTLTVNGSPAIPTLDSDWLELAPGEHVLRMDRGTGAATVTWVERWYF